MIGAAQSPGSNLGMLMIGVAVDVGNSTRVAVTVVAANFGASVAVGSLVGACGVWVESEDAYCVGLLEHDMRLSIKIAAMSFRSIPGRLLKSMLLKSFTGCSFPSHVLQGC